MEKTRWYLAIDLKSFYASVECMAQKLDPLDTLLVVADESRTDKTICLAVSPALKSFGVPGRPRLFEVNQIIRRVNAAREYAAPEKKLTGASCSARELSLHPDWQVSFHIAKPRMSHYMEVSTRIYSIYTRFVSPEDIHVYSIDEVFVDVTGYLSTYQCTPRELAMRMIRAVLSETGITATCGIGTNLYLAKIAMDIVAKHIPADKDGVRIAELDEISYRKTLWAHQPLTDFWRVGRGYARKLEKNGMHTMGDVALCSLGPPYFPFGEDKLYKLFGVNAELLIDHAWGIEPCTIADIKAYRPQEHSISNGQVLQNAYERDKAKLIVREMTEALTLELAEKHLVTNQLVLTVGYDKDTLEDPARKAAYTGPMETDRYGRRVPKMAHGSTNLKEYTCSTRLITEAMMELYDKIVHPALTVRRIYVVAAHVLPESDAPKHEPIQLDMFTDYAQEEEKQKQEAAALEKEKKRQQAILKIKQKYGRNAILKGMDFEEGATARERNAQIGGHKA